MLQVSKVKGRPLLKEITIAPRERGPLTNGVYKVVGRESGLSLSVKDGVRQTEWSDDAAHKWEFTNLGAGQYLVVNKEAGGALNRIFFGSDKVNVVWYGWQSPSADQRWILRPAEKGFARICPAATGHDVAIPSKDAGAELQQGKAPFAGESFREWKVVPPEAMR